MKLRWLPIGLAMTAMATRSVYARADASADAAAAETLSAAAATLMAEGQYDAACARYAESYRLEDSARRLFELAECNERRGMTASAWSEFREARRLAEAKNEAALAREAEARQTRLEPIVGRVKIVVPVESDVDGLEVQCDDVLVPAGSYGIAVPIDAGTHVVVAHAPGRVPWSMQFRVAPGKTTVSVMVQRLSPEIAGTPKHADAAPARAAAGHRIDRDDGTTERTVGLVLGGVGLASLVAGAWLGFDAASAQHELRAQCSGGYCPSGVSHSLDQRGRQAAGADMLLGLGVASSISAAIFFLASPSAPARERGTTALHVSPALAPGGGGVVAAGKF